MKIEHCIKIARLKRETIGSYENVVVGANWVLVSYCADAPDRLLTSTPGESTFNISASDLSSNFIDYASLEENNVSSWVELNIPESEINEMKLNNENKLKEMDQIRPEKQRDLPWY